MDNGANNYRRFLEGDDSGIEELVREYKDGLLLYINSYLNNLSASEDCVQDTFIKLITKKPKYRGNSSFKTWLYSIGRNMALYYLRRNKGRSIQLDECIQQAAETDLEREYLVEEQKIIVHRAIRRLKEEHQQVLYLSFFEGFSYKEICVIMGKTYKEVDNLLYKAKKKLKSELEREGFQYEGL